MSGLSNAAHVVRLAPPVRRHLADEDLTPDDQTIPTTLTWGGRPVRVLKVIVAVLALMTPACQSIQMVQPKARLAVEAPADMKSLDDVKYKLEVTLN